MLVFERKSRVMNWIANCGSILKALCPSSRWKGLATVIGGLSLVFTTSADDLHLNFGLYSSKKPTEMVKQYRPLIAILETNLSKMLNVPVSIHTQIVKTYQEGIESIVTGTCDFSQIGPAAYVHAKGKSAEVEILAVESARGQKSINGVICVLSNSPVRTIAELKGKTFAFGDQFSTTGRYSSQQFLLEHGIAGRDLAKFDYLERHDRVGAAVAAGDYDAGALNERTFRKLNEETGRLRALALFPVVGRPWIARAGLPANIKAALREALLGVKDESVLSALGEEGLIFLSGHDSDFQETRVAVQTNDRFIKQ